MILRIKRQKHIVGKPVPLKKPRLAMPKIVQRAIVSGDPIWVAKEKTSAGKVIDFNKPGYCSGYAVRAVKQLFGLEYQKGHAWELAFRNNIVKRFAGKNNPPISLVAKFLLPGRLIGLFNPGSKHNNSQRLYTHIAIYLGTYNGVHYIMHNYNGPEIQPLGRFLEKKNLRVVDVIGPKTGVNNV